MKKHLVVLISVVVLVCVGVLAAAPSNQWEFLSTTDTGASPFIKAHPKWDGRGVLIAVCDSGVDLGLPGLLKTSDDKAKIVDARVFCSEGKIDLEDAILSSDEHGKAYHGKDGKWLYGVDSLKVKPAKDAKVYVGYFKENDFKNSDVKGGDLNNNGSSDDVYGLLVFKNTNGDDAKWVGIVDTNGDGNLGDEKVVGDFSDTHNIFSLRGRDLHSRAAQMGFALNLWPKEKKAALYMADGSHGTHVSGIAAGYRLEGRTGFNGIAPGAQILALKIGDNSLSGGATTAGSMISAWRYAVKKAKELKMPLVIQMSYGIGSEQEGQSEAERLIDKLLKENPNVIATVAAGNDGPGISTVGLPACGSETLSIAAVLPKSSARDLFGVSLSRDELFSFSSRGGEIDKPDVAAPGVAASTVPNYEHGANVFRGTSMASPQAAGACAILLSASKASGIKVTRAMVNAAVRRGAVPIRSYGPLDQGSGLINIPRSWEILKKLAARGAETVVQFDVETTSPEMVGGKGPAIFWRGDYFPKSPEKQIVKVKPVFSDNVSADFKARFYAAFDLVSTASWLKVDKGSVFMKAEKAASVPVSFDAGLLRRPGLYQARILAFRKGASSEERLKMGPEWSVPASVVIPADLGYKGDFTYRHAYTGLRAGKVQRTFLNLSPEAAALRIKLKAPAGQDALLVGYLYDPEGRESDYTFTRKGRTEGILSPDEGSLVPGVWEVDVYSYYSNKATADVTLTATTLPLAHASTKTLDVSVKQGESPRGSVKLTSALPSVFHAKASGKLIGSVVEKVHNLSSSTWTKSFKVAPGESGVHFRLSMPPEDWNLFTDVAVMILDSEGKAVVSTGMGYRFITLDLDAPKPGASYKLKVIGATADPDSTPSWKLRLKEAHLYAKKIPVSVLSKEKGSFVLYPNHPTSLTLKVNGVPPAIPDDATWLVEVKLKDTRRPEFSFPLEFKLKPEK